MSSPSVLSQQFAIIVNPFKDHMKTVMMENNFPAFYNELQNLQVNRKAVEEELLFERSFLKEGPLMRIIQNAAFVTASSPDVSFQELLTILPMCSVEDGDKSVPTTSGVPLVGSLYSPQWDDQIYRYCYQIQIETILSQFLVRNLLCRKNTNPQALETVSNLLVDFLYPKKPYPALYERLRLINYKNWAQSIHLLARVCPAFWAKVFIEKIPPEKSEPAKYEKYFHLFQWLYISTESQINYQALPAKLKDIIDFSQGSKIFISSHYASMSFFKNLMGYLLVSHPQYCSEDFIYDVSEIAAHFIKRVKDYKGPAFSMRGLVYTFSSHKKMKCSLHEYILKYICDRGHLSPALASQHLETLVYFIRGKYWESSCELARSGERFTWVTKDNQDDLSPAEFISEVFKTVLQYGDSYTDAQPELADFLLQFASVDFNSFVKNNLQKVLDKKFLDNNYPAIFLFAHDVLSPESLFLKCAPRIEKGNIETFKNKIFSKLEECINDSKIYTTSSVFSVQSLIETLNLCTPPASKSISYSNLQLQVTIHNLLETSAAFNTPPKPKLVIPPSQKAFADLLPNTYKQSLFSENKNMELTPAILKEYKPKRSPILTGLSVIPFLDVKTDFITKLVPFVFSNESHLASLSLRVLQSLIIQNSEFLSFAIVQICTKVPGTSEYLAIQMQAIKQILDVGAYVHASISDEAVALIFENLLIAICSPHPIIRSKVIEIYTSLSNVSNRQEPNLSRFFQSQSKLISLNTIRLIISAFNYQKNLDLSNITCLSFEQAVSSNYELLYLFSLLALGEAISNPENNLVSYLERCSTKIVKAIGSFQEKEPYFYLNLIIFMAALRGPSQIEYLTNQSSKIFTTISKLYSDRLEFPQVAFLKAFHPTVTVSILNDHEPKTEVDFHIQASIIRYLLDVLEDSEKPILLKRCNYIISQFKDLCNLEELKFRALPNSNYLNEHPQMHLCLNNILIFIRAYYEKLFEEKKIIPNGPFPLQEVYPKETPTNQDNSTFIFLTNISFIDENIQPTQTLASEALAAFSKCYDLPDKYFNSLCHKLDSLSRISSKTFATILTNYYQILLPQFLVESMTKPRYFEAIAAQFSDLTPEQLISRLEEKAGSKTSLEESQIINTTYNHCGTILALAFYKICSNNISQREAGYCVLLSVAIPVIMITTPSANISLAVFKINNLKSVLLSQNPELIQKEMAAISKSLSKSLKFCAEQFLMEAFTLAKSKEVEPFLASVTPFFSLCTLGLQDIPGIIKPDDDEKSRAIAASFSRFSSFSFIQLFIENVVTVPISRITISMLDSILRMNNESNTPTAEFLILCLFALQKTSLQNNKKCVAILSYLMTRESDTVCDMLQNFFRYKGWFYYQIQLSRIDLMFDIQKFLDGIQSDEKKDSSSSNPIVTKKRSQTRSPAQLKDIEIPDINYNSKNKDSSHKSHRDSISRDSSSGKGHREGHREGHKDGRRDIRIDGHKDGRRDIRIDGHKDDHKDDHRDGNKNKFRETVSIGKCLTDDALFSVSARDVKSSTRPRTSKSFRLIDEAPTFDPEEPQYESSIKFSISAVISLLKENPTNISKIIHIVILFCILNYPLFNGTPKNLLENVNQYLIQKRNDEKRQNNAQTNVIPDVSEENSVIAKLSEYCNDNSLTPSILTAIFDYLKTLPESQLDDMALESLKWATSCGELSIALKATKISQVLMSSRVVDKEAISVILRSLHIVTKTITQRMDPNFHVPPSQQLFMAEKPNYDGAYLYVSELLRILQKATSYLPSPSEEVFWFAHNSLICYDVEFNSVVYSAISILLEMLSDNTFSQSIVSSYDQPGLLNDIFRISHKAESLKLAFDLIFELISNNSIRILTDLPAEYVLLGILPYLWMLHETEDVSDVVNALSTTVSSNKISRLLKGQWGEIDQFAREIVFEALPIISQHSTKIESPVALLISFYTTMARVSKNALGVIVSIARVFLAYHFEHKDDKLVPLESFIDLGTRAVQDRDPTRNTTVTMFLSDISGLINLSHNDKHVKAKFPDIPLKTPINPSDWSFNDQDAFQKIGSLPPFLFVDIEFIGTDNQVPIQSVVQAVKVFPFSQWSNTMFQAETTAIQNQDLMAPDQVNVTVPNDFVEFLKKVQKGLEIKSENEIAQSNKEDLKSTFVEMPLSKLSGFGLNNLATSSENVNPVDNLIEMNVAKFLPSGHDIDSLGSDLLSGFNIPSFFPENNL